MKRPEWDDERLSSAFHERFDQGAPATLASDVRRALAGTRPSRLGAFGRGPAWVLATAAVIVILAGGALIGLGGLNRPGAASSAPSSSGTAATPSADLGPASPSSVQPPTSVLGLDVMTVSAAEAVRDAGVDDTEIAIRGWFTPPPVIACTHTLDGYASNPLLLDCAQALTWLDQDAESLVHVTETTWVPSAPQSPALNPVLGGLDLSWKPLPLSAGVVADSKPAAVVFIGHFDDRRASACPAGQRADCQDRFVVDSVAWADGAVLPRSMRGLTDSPWTSSLPDIEAVVANEAPDSPILSLEVVQGPIIGDIEPSLVHGEGGLSDRPGLWIVRVLESDRLSTYIVDDGTNQIYEMNPEGQAVSVGGPLVPTSPSPSAPWPPVGAIVIPLTGEVVPGAPPVQLAVIDHSGRLVGVAEKGDVDPSDPSISVGDPGGYAEPGKPGRVHVAWTGSICDSRITVTIAADLRTITFDMGRRPPCDTIGISRQFVLDFSGSVDVSTIEFPAQPTIETDVPALTVDHPNVIVSPSTHLHDGQTVEVHITGFGVGGKVFLSECASVAEAIDLGCGAELAAQTLLVTDDSRSGLGSFVVQASAHGKSYTGEPATPCIDQCVLVATIGGGFDFVVTPIAFDRP
jgi:hypothetical protein